MRFLGDLNRKRWSERLILAIISKSGHFLRTFRTWNLVDRKFGAYLSHVHRHITKFLINPHNELDFVNVSIHDFASNDADEFPPVFGFQAFLKRSNAATSAKNCASLEITFSFSSRTPIVSSPPILRSHSFSLSSMVTIFGESHPDGVSADGHWFLPG
jgi:hypothetical protein